MYPSAIDVGSRYHTLSPLEEKPGGNVAERQAGQVSSPIMILLMMFLNHWTCDDCCRLSWSWLWKRLRKSWSAFNLLPNVHPQKWQLHQVKSIRVITPMPKNQRLAIQRPHQLTVRTLVLLLHLLLLLPCPNLRQGWTIIMFARVCFLCCVFSMVLKPCFTYDIASCFRDLQRQLLQSLLDCEDSVKKKLGANSIVLNGFMKLGKTRVTEQT